MPRARDLVTQSNVHTWFVSVMAAKRDRQRRAAGRTRFICLCAGAKCTRAILLSSPLRRGLSTNWWRVLNKIDGRLVWLIGHDMVYIYTYIGYIIKKKKKTGEKKLLKEKKPTLTNPYRPLSGVDWHNLLILSKHLKAWQVNTFIYFFNLL